MSKRPKYSPTGLLLTSMAMLSMRETAFGNRAYFATKEITERAIRMRDDDALLAAAEVKRARKAAARMKAAQK